MLAPAKTPKDTLAQLEGWFAAAGQSADLKEKLAALGIYPNIVCGNDYGAILRRQNEQYGTNIRASNIKEE